MPKNDKELPFISVVVLNWNGKRFVDPFMKSFLAQTYPKDRMELIFTDNGSVDDSVEYLNKKYSSKYPFIKVVLTGKNYGYAGGNNRGIKQAKGDYVMLCNNDLELDKDVVKELVAAAQKHDGDVTTVKLMFLNKPGYINNAGSRLEADNDWPIYEIGIEEKDKGQYDSDREISAFCGACVLIKRDFLHTVGMFDGKFFLYFEDGDLSWRGQRAGKKFIYAHKAIAKHFHVGSSNGAGSPKFNFYVGRNRLLILVKNAKLKVFLRGLAKTGRDHVLLRVYRLWLAARGKYDRKLAMNEFLQSQKMLWSFVRLFPYACLKRWGIVKEETL